MTNLFEQGILAQVDSIVAMLKTMPLDDHVAMLNTIRRRLHEASPFKDEPVDFVEWVPNEQVKGNEYNPNTVAPPEMKALKRSITQDGYTMGIVSFPLSKLIHRMKSEGLSLQEIAQTLKEPIEKIQAFDAMGDGREVVDGFHRHRVGKEDKVVRERVHGYLPLSSIKSDRTDLKHRMAATVRHNRARGVHGVVPMADMVANLIKQGWQDADIAKELGMDADEVLRFKQNLGLPELFKDHEFSPSWS
jgi:ParB-like chromosome segregation protein Spo0J